MYAITSTEGQLKTYVKLNKATTWADQHAGENQIEVQVIHVPTSVVAYVVNPRALRKRADGTWFAPWTRVETPKHAAPEIEGFIPAYTRRRIQATVYRGLEKGAGWLVHDGRTGGRCAVANTTEARHLTTAMKNGQQL